MPRPVKYRCVESIPRVTFFQPMGVPFGNWEEVVLSIEEAEAIRLKDLEGLDQEESARRMHVSSYLPEGSRVGEKEDGRGID